MGHIEQAVLGCMSDDEARQVISIEMYEDPNKMATVKGGYSSIQLPNEKSVRPRKILQCGLMYAGKWDRKPMNKVSSVRKFRRYRL